MLDLHTGGGSLTRLLPVAQRQVALSEQAQLQAWCFDFCRWLRKIGALVDQLLEKPLKAKDLDVYLLMQLGVFQLMHSNVAEHAAVDETVKVTRRLKKPWAKSLVNAILRNFIRRRSELESSLADTAAYAHPGWLLDLLRSDWPERWQLICDANNRRGPMTLRVNGLRGDVLQYAERLNERGIVGKTIPDLPEAFVLETPVGVLDLPGFTQGCCGPTCRASFDQTLARWRPLAGCLRCPRGQERSYTGEISLLFGSCTGQGRTPRFTDERDVPSLGA
jgi:16S rRNA (cytosine967-C5)-methyltransferase